MGQITELENVCLFIGNKDYSCRYTWDATKVAGRQQNMAPMWKKLMKLVDLEQPTSFLDPENLGCSQRECKPNEIIIEEYKERHSALVLFPGIVSHHALAGSLRLESMAALLQQLGHCAERTLHRKGVSSLPLHAQIIASSLHSGGEGGSHKQIRESACQFHLKKSALVCTQKFTSRVIADELQKFSPVKLHCLCPRRRMVSRAHTSADST